MPRSPVNRIHDLKLVHAIAVFEYLDLSRRPSVSSPNDELIMGLTHAEHSSAQVVLEDVEEDLHVKPDAEVNYDGEHGARRDWVEVREYSLVGPEAQKTSDDGDWDDKACKSNSARANPGFLALLQQFFRIHFSYLSFFL